MSPHIELDRAAHVFFVVVSLSCIAQPIVLELLRCIFKRHFLPLSMSSRLFEMSTARVSLAEVFHPWVRWEGPGSGFENSSGGVWKSRVHRFGPLGIEVEKRGFRTVRLITGQKFP